MPGTDEFGWGVDASWTRAHPETSGFLNKRVLANPEGVLATCATRLGVGSIQEVW